MDLHVMYTMIEEAGNLVLRLTVEDRNVSECEEFYVLVWLCEILNMIGTLSELRKVEADGSVLNREQFRISLRAAFDNDKTVTFRLIDSDNLPAMHLKDAA